MGDHTETLEIDFDATRISFEELLEEFWKNHNPLRDSYRGRQYMSILMYHDEMQKGLAIKSKKNWEVVLKGEIQTEIVPYSKFFSAEDYHQKYYLKRRQTTIDTLSRLYMTHEDLVNSTLVARLNGFFRGYGTLDGVKKDLNNWGISLNDQQAIINLVSSIRW
jgi:peptide-methionine (S)-S-oxide reductase